MSESTENTYMQGCIETCFSLSTSIDDFIAEIKQATGLADSGINQSQCVQDILSRAKK